VQNFINKNPLKAGVFYLKNSIICSGTPVLPLVRAAEVRLDPIDAIIGKKLFLKVNIMVGRAIAIIIITITYVLLSTAMFYAVFNNYALECLILQ